MDDPVKPRNRPVIYIAGSSREMGRARRAMISASSIGYEVATDWVSQIKFHEERGWYRVDKGVGEANPSDRIVEKRAWAKETRDAINRSHALWFLVPTTATSGAWLELGLAFGRGIPIVCSGQDQDQSIYVRGCGVCFESDHFVTAWLRWQLVEGKLWR